MTPGPTDPPQSTRAAVLIPFGIVTLIWGSTWLVIRDQIAVVPPSWSISYRFLVASIAMAIYAGIKRESFRFDARGYAFAAVIGVALFTFNFNFVYRAEHYVTSGLVAVVFALLLVPNAIFGRIFLKQRLGRQLMVGCAVAMAGVALLFVNEARVDPHGPRSATIGIVLTLCAVMAASIANVIQGSAFAKRYPMAPTLAARASTQASPGSRPARRCSSHASAMSPASSTSACSPPRSPSRSISTSSARSARPKRPIRASSCR
jgi:drug/metabolite transporter (DMT)-like permease